MRRFVVVLAIVVAACSSETANTTVPAVECEDPPGSEIEEESSLEMSVSPNPAGVRETVSLSVSSTGLPEDALSGVDAGWQCWDGSGWATTHVVYRGFGDNPGQTIPVNSDFQITVPSIGLELDTGFPIVIPEVGPGMYRIFDEVFVDGDPVSGFVFVEVAG